MTGEVRLSFTPTAEHWHWVYQTWGARRWLLIRTLALFLFAVGLLLLAGAAARGA
ncbi:hypothetical protein ACFQO7_16215 [Catellatospora aurea]|uniref:Uncharacterized protein n=1 Tax=Catellatospora aurea TaxID=1337874 RepID=A0ABW2GWN3_9ACTN